MTTATLTVEPLATPYLLRTRRVLLRVLYAPLALLALVMAQGLVLQLAGQIPEGPYGFAAASTTAWKALSLFGFLGIFWTAGRSVCCVQWLIVGQVTWAVVEGLAPQEPTEPTSQAVVHNLVNAGFFLVPWLLLAPERRELLRLHAAPDRVALAVVGLTAPLLVWWALDNRSLGIPDADGLQGTELRFDLVGLAVAFLTVGLLAALRPGGTRWLLRVVGGGALGTGVAALLADAGDLATPGRLGGLALVAGGSVLVLRGQSRSWATR